MPSAPIELSQLDTAPDDAEDGMPDGEQYERPRFAILNRVRALLPPNSLGHRHAYYTDAIAEFEAPPSSRFDDRFCYRLLRVQPPRTLRFGWGGYFEYLDTSEVLALEVANAMRWDGDEPLPLSSKARLPLRGDPFALSDRCAVAGVDTLTLVRRGDTYHMVLMKRSQGPDVASAHGVYHVMPAGEHQPASFPRRLGSDPDFDVWRTIVREYAEEFLGAPEIRDTADWIAREPYRAIFEARRREEVRAHYLGVGLDPLSLKAEILTACVWQEDAYHRIFRDLRPSPEGEAIELPFDADTVAYYANVKRTLPAGVACLLLAWRAFGHPET